GSYRYNAKRRGIPFKLTKKQFMSLVTRPCFYCGAPPSRRKGASMKTLMNMNGVDRIDSSQGYTLNNCVPCCLECNGAKGPASLKQFFDLVKRIYERHRAYFVGS